MKKEGPFEDRKEQGRREEEEFLEEERRGGVGRAQGVVPFDNTGGTSGTTRKPGRGVGQRDNSHCTAKVPTYVLVQTPSRAHHQPAGLSRASTRWHFTTGVPGRLEPW